MDMETCCNRNFETNRAQRVENDYQLESIYENTLSNVNAEYDNFEVQVGDNQENIHTTEALSKMIKGYRFKKEYFILIFYLVVFVGLLVTVIVLYNKNESTSSEVKKMKFELDDLKSQLEIRANQNAPGNTSTPWCASENVTCEACPSTSFHFPRVDQTIDYVQYIGSIPALNEFTVCMWLETDDYIDNRDTIFSYAVLDRHNELWIFFENANDIGLGLYSFGPEATILSHPTFVGNVTVHICVWFSTFLQRASLYLNGTSTSSQHTTKPSLQGGGTLVLGQDQDSVGGGFSSPQSYHGNITNVIIWPRVLSSQEISNVARRCVCPSDHVVAMTSQSVTVFGNVIQSIPLRCPML